ncbi:MAG: hypothetical protein MH137_10135 [Flavobacteriales bacterium]|nr:hypothetical protein [Flavobacteriales bacterium]
MKKEDFNEIVELIKKKEFHTAEIKLDKFIGSNHGNKTKAMAIYLLYCMNLGLGKQNQANKFLKDFFDECYKKNGDSNVQFYGDKFDFFGISLNRFDKEKEDNNLIISINPSLVSLMVEFIPDLLNVSIVPNQEK